MGLPGRLSLFSAVYALVVGGLTFVAFVWADPYAQWPRTLDLEDLFFTTPVAAIAAIVLGVIERVRRRRWRASLVSAVVFAALGLAAFAYLLLGLMGAAALLQNI
jgi:hypothetical protein